MARLDHQVKRIIAVDFDGCLCDSTWPECGPPIMSVINKVKAEQAKGSVIILWSCRTDEPLQKAIDWCREYGIEFDAVNEQIPEQLEYMRKIQPEGNIDPRKIYATEYWDDRVVLLPDKRESVATSPTGEVRIRRRRRQQKWYNRIWQAFRRNHGQ